MDKSEVRMCCARTPAPGAGLATTQDVFGENRITRRNALELMGAALVGLPVVGVGLLAVGDFVGVPRRAFSGSVAPDEVPAGLVADLKDGVPATVAFGDETVFVIKLGNAVKAYSGTCTHAGCLIKFYPKSKHFTCPCHDGVYDLQGRVISGPPPRGLFEHKVRVSMGRVIVGKRIE